MPNQNAIGDFGESIFTTRLSEHYQFKIYFLGEKAPFIDFLVELVDTVKPYPFYVQVKSTTKGYYKKTGYIKASVPNNKLLELIKRPLPTYVAGVDTLNEKVYLCPAFDRTISYTKGMPITHILCKAQPVATKATLDLLVQDVKDFWDNSGMNVYKQNYRSLL